MSKKIIRNNKSIIDGINEIVDTIKVTLGPKGKCVALQGSFGGPDITRDGATVAKGIEFKDPGMNMGAQLVKNAAIATEDQAGDATSTTSILIQEFVKAGSVFLDRPDINFNELKSGMQKTTELVTQYIKESSIPVADDLEKIRKVATISANNDPQVGDLIVEAMQKVGIDGVITADVTSGLETTIDVTQGFKIERGWASPHFVNSATDGKCIMENPVILVTSERLSTIPPLVPIIEAVAKQGRGLLIVADDIDDLVLNMLAFNVLQGALKCCVIKGIDFGDSRKNIMEDISVAVGAQFVCPEYGLTLDKCTLDMLGSAEKVTVSKDHTVIINGGGDPEVIKDRLEVLKERLKSPDTSTYEKTKFKTRISGLSGGVAVIKAAGVSETESQNRKATIEDAILAAQSAVAEGVVAGGGYTLLKAASAVQGEIVASEWTPSEIAGSDVILSSLPVITSTIAENCGECGKIVIKEISDSGLGYNAKTGEYCDLIEAGVLDSAKSLRVAIENACSAASMVLLTDSVVIEEPETNSSL